MKPTTKKAPEIRMEEVLLRLEVKFQEKITERVRALETTDGWEKTARLQSSIGAIRDSWKMVEYHFYDEGLIEDEDDEPADTRAFRV